MRDLLDAHTKSGIMGNVGLREYGLHGLRLAPTASAPFRLWKTHL
jgi:hypothetical protein